MMKTVCKHTEEKWVQIYIERWLKAPIQYEDGTVCARNCGTPQGGVISPVLSNLFLHYVFDIWMSREHSEVPWCRYADDGLLHCKTEAEAQLLLSDLSRRFAECGLELHPEKTKIVYCKDSNRKGKYPQKEFTFLGYTFRARRSKNSRDNTIFASFTPAVSKAALKSMRAKTKKYNVRNRTDLELKDIAKWFNPILQGWLNYYGQYNRSSLYQVWRHFNLTLVAWAMKKYKRLNKRKTRAGKFLEMISKKEPTLFAHWRVGMVGVFV
jgi:RNA-directed DNA polymerase